MNGGRKEGYQRNGKEYENSVKKITSIGMHEKEKILQIEVPTYDLMLPYASEERERE